MSLSNYKIYKHTNLLNGKVYIGVTSQELHKRWQKGAGYSRTYFGDAIKKYGWDSFSHEVLLDGLSKEDALVLEMDYIKQYDSTNPQKGYNVSIGGQTMYCNPQYGKDNNRASSVFRIDPKTNERVFFETIKDACIKMGINHRGISKACRGVCKTYKGYVWEYADKQFKKPIKCARGCYPHDKQKKKVKLIDVDGSVHMFDSLNSAAEYANTRSSNISRYVNGSRVDSTGRRWSICL